jgi:Rrf2 family protein
MVKITKKTDYGLTLITALAQKPEELQSLRSISDNHNLPYKFIGQIAASLLDAKLIVSKEGASGGYKLAKPANQISLKTILEILEGPVVKVDCLNGKKCSREHNCAHRHVLDGLSSALNESLSQKTVADLLTN